MNKNEIKQALIKSLAPIYKARVDFIDTIDPNFYRSSQGEAEILNMALISAHFKKLSSERELKRIHDDYFSTVRLREGKKKLLNLLRENNWNVDFDQHGFRKLIHHFAEDAGVDDFYNAIELTPKEKAPIDRFGNIKNWNEMQHSQVLSAPIKAYYFEDTSQSVRKISQDEVSAFCKKQSQSNVETKRSFTYTHNTQPQPYAR